MTVKILFHQVLAKLESLSSTQLIAFFAMLAGLITVRIHYIHMGWINSDSVLYLEAAKWMLAGEFSKALAIYNWPFYSICIATVSKILHTPIFFSAQLLSTVFFMLTTTAMLNIVSLLGGNNRTIVIAAITLFGCDYIVGDILPMLMRDQGYWAFLLVSIWALIKFMDHPSWWMGSVWQLTVMMATLFRIEGIFYLALPLILLFQQEQTWGYRLSSWFKANYLNLIGLALLLIGFAVLDSQQLGRLQELSPSSIMHAYSAKLLSKSDMMSEQVLGKFLNEYGLFVILVGLFLITIIKSILSAGVICSALCFNYLYKSANNTARLRVIYGVMIISLISMYLIISKVFILSGRYTIAMAFMLIMIASLAIKQLIEDSAQRYRKLIAIVVLAIFSITLLKNILPKTQGFAFRKEAAMWLKQHNSHHQPVFFNDVRVAYYYGDERLFEKISAQRNNREVYLNPQLDSLKAYKFIVVYATKQDKALYQLLESTSDKFVRIKLFANDKHDKNVSIFENINY